MAQTHPATPRPVRRWRADPITRIGTLLPFVLAIYMDLMARPLTSGMFAGPPAILGFPAMLVIQWALIGWAGIAAWIVWSTPSRVVAALAFILGTVVSLVGLTFGPALLLIWQNLGGAAN